MQTDVNAQEDLSHLFAQYHTSLFEQVLGPKTIHAELSHCYNFFYVSNVTF